jgi:hypothetical protein
MLWHDRCETQLPDLPNGLWVQEMTPSDRFFGEVQGAGSPPVTAARSRIAALRAALLELWPFSASFWI